MDDETDTDNNAIGRDTADKIAGLKDGKIFGFIPLVEPFRTIYDIFSPDIVSYVSKLGEPAINKAVTTVFEKMRLPNAPKAGYWAGRVAAYGIPYIEDLLNVVATVKTHGEERKWVLSQLAPLLAANKATDGGGIAGFLNGGYGGNKMVTDALAVVTKHTYRNLGQDATNAIPRVIQGYGTNLLGKREKAEKLGQDTTAIDRQLGFIGDYGNKIAGAVRTGIAKAVQGEDCKTAVCQTALGNVLGIEEYVRQNELDGLKGEPSKYHVDELTTKVIDVFQAFQKQQHHGLIPKHRMQEVAHMIAEKLVYGEMRALSLVNIIGREELLNDKKNGLVGTEKVEAVLAKEIGILSKSSTIDANAFLAELNYTLDDLKTRLQSNDKDEKALLVISHPEPVLIAAGMKKEEIIELRKALSGRIAENMLGAVIESLIPHKDGQLEEMGLNREAIEFIRDYESDPEILTRALKSPARKERAMSVVRTALMATTSGDIGDILKNGKKPRARTQRTENEDDGQLHDAEEKDVDTSRRGIRKRTRGEMVEQEMGADRDRY